MPRIPNYIQENARKQTKHQKAAVKHNERIREWILSLPVTKDKKEQALAYVVDLLENGNDHDMFLTCMADLLKVRIREGES